MAIGLGAARGASAAPPAGSRPLKQVAGVLDYIAGDYRGAVDDQGRVLEAGEYAEQQSLARDAQALADQAGVAADAPLRARLVELSQALTDKQPPARVSALCRAARLLLVTQYGLALGPSQPPSRSEGVRLYASQGCAGCHGADGGADTEAAHKLTPHPANFLDPARVAAVSPHRAYSAISFGVAGTAMKSYSQLSDAQRWSLAFYVLSLRHAANASSAGKQVVEKVADLPRDPGGLAALSEEDILGRLSSVRDPSAREAALAYLRGQAPFADAAQAAEGESSSLFVARRAVQRGLRAYREGDVAGARRAFISAYLDGFEPHEAAIGARDRTLVREVESKMLALRQATASGAPVARITQLVTESDALLARAEQGGDAGSTALLGALTIALREGVEIALLIGALLALVRRRGASELVRHVHAGWIAASLAGLLTWWGMGELLSGLQRELAEGIAALLAATVLLGVTHWLLGQLTSRRWLGFLADRVSKAAVGRGAALGVFGLSFIAVYREAFEVVLFFKALLLDAGERQGQVWLGAGIGLLLLGVVAVGLQRVGQRLKPRPFMLASSGLLALLSLVLAGNGIRALQEAAVLPMHALGFPELPLLGVYATREGLLVQGVVLVFLIGSALWPLRARLRNSDSPQPAE